MSISSVLNIYLPGRDNTGEQQEASLKVYSVAALVLLVFVALDPARPTSNHQP
jgi:hypothetical protein